MGHRPYVIHAFFGLSVGSKGERTAIVGIHIDTLRHIIAILYPHGNGRVGYGLGKANEVPDAIRKAIERAKKEIVKVQVLNGTIPHETKAKYGTSEVFMKPAREGTGVIAGRAVRAVVEVAGITNILTKCYGSRNYHNVVKATIKGLATLKSSEMSLKQRGKTKGEEA